ncbi:hypothetical protein [Hymenobacter sediminicola]|uniref:Uncharacterized protein n=1 Tax=Hymenobacter sediminicola TaxID=2761579 RepID=A0A7G7W307_9BACT|nr:hypothetical protein [Hymenobacter sediminicola]QNH60750.1 hypothetical protein H4317_11165 [Hymenobacter sediminicola]
MKYLSTLLFALATLVSCSKDSKKEDPEPKYHITVHVTGQNLAGLNTSARITSTYDFAGVNNQTGPGPGYTEAYSTATVDKTYDLGEFGAYDLVEVQLTYPATRPTGTVLKADILVDGVVKKSCGTATSNNYAAIETDNL